MSGQKFAISLRVPLLCALRANFLCEMCLEKPLPLLISPFRRFAFFLCNSSTTTLYYYPFLCSSLFSVCNSPGRHLLLTPLHFRIVGIPFGIQSTLLWASLLPFSFFTPLCFAVSTPILSRALLSTLIIFSSAFCFYIRQFHIFFFSRHSQSFSATSCFRVSILPFTNRGSSPSHCHFYFVFSAARQASLYLPRVSV